MFPTEYSLRTPSVSARVTVSGLAALLVEEARDSGCPDFAARIDECLVDFLATLPKEERRSALLMTYAITAPEPAAPRPKLKLVYSRD